MESSPFTRWSRWFEEALTNYHEEYPMAEAEWRVFNALKPDILAVMGWIISSADSSGTGFGLDNYSDESIAREVGSSSQKIRGCFEALAKVGLIDLIEDQPASPFLKACLSSAGAPRDAQKCERLIAFFPWNRSER